MYCELLTSVAFRKGRYYCVFQQIENGNGTILNEINLRTIIKALKCTLLFTPTVLNQLLFHSKITRIEYDVFNKERKCKPDRPLTEH